MPSLAIERAACVLAGALLGIGTLELVRAWLRRQQRRGVAEQASPESTMMARLAMKQESVCVATRACQTLDLVPGGEGEGGGGGKRGGGGEGGREDTVESQKLPGEAQVPRHAATDEAERNFYFRLGDREHTFEHGQQLVPEWRGKTEETVLLDRVACGVKPVASFVVGSGASKDSQQSVEYKNELCSMAEQRGLVVSSVTNDWGMEVMYVCRADRVDSTLAELLEARIQEPHAAELTLPAELGSRRVGAYARSSFDCYLTSPMRHPSAKVSVLESALLFGYPFGLAHRLQHSAPSEDGSNSEDEGDSGPELSRAGDA